MWHEQCTVLKCSLNCGDLVVLQSCCSAPLEVFREAGGQWIHVQLMRAHSVGDMIHCACFTLVVGVNSTKYVLFTKKKFTNVT